MKHRFILLLPFVLMTAMFVSSCSMDENEQASADLGSLANEYLFLELSMGWHDNAHVDAYFGPEEIRAAANEAQLSLADIQERALALVAALKTIPLEPQPNGANAARIDGLQRRLQALNTRIELNMGVQHSFDEEAERLFGATAPDHDADYFQAILGDIDSLLEGEGALSDRVDQFQSQFAIPANRLADVFDAAITECRRRTLRYIDLPENESFSIEFVNNKPWSGYNWYQGNARSLIQVNTDLPIYISRAVDLGCHEGYPGHHTFNTLLEKNLVQDNGWAEFSIYPLFSPQSLVAEGSGNYGIELAFPGEERIAFEKEVLFPLAGLDTTMADRYYALQALLARLNYAGNEAARDYLNGAMTRDQAVEWLVDYALNSPDRARQRTEFFDAYRSYVINYNLGQDLVRDYVERGATGMAERWDRFEKLLSSPMTAADLK